MSPMTLCVNAVSMLIRVPGLSPQGLPSACLIHQLKALSGSLMHVFVAPKAEVGCFKVHLPEHC
jgi:hypothetical protein